MMRVLFLGEGSLNGPARYLAAILKASGILFDHRPDRARIPKAWRRKSYQAFILSDYRYASFTPCAREWMIGEVHNGAGLLMIGGWASFTGSVGGYAGTAIEKLLPVTCIRGDDRVQKATGAFLFPTNRFRKSSFPPVTGGESIDPPSVTTGDDGSSIQPPIVCGYHRAKPKPGTKTTMIFRDITLNQDRIQLGPPHPALVLGQAGLGRTAAFLTDCAPHWAGGLVDWGSRRIHICVGSDNVEVGNEYVRFFRQLLVWLSKK